MELGQASREAFAATWHDEHDAVVGRSYGGTVCWFPRLPGRLRIQREDFEAIVRCRECPGCLELDRRRLADRLVARYGDGSAPTAGDSQKADQPSANGAVGNRRTLFLVRVYIPVAKHAKLSHYLHRFKRFELEPGFWRLGTRSIGFLAGGFAPLSRWLAARRLRCRIESLKLKRGRRAFRSITAGVLVAREQYGANLNRWYAAGLPQLERDKWEVMKRDYEKGYQRATSPRAWKRRRLVLVPPAIWSLSRPSRQKLRAALRVAHDPERVQAVADLVQGFAGARSLSAGLTDHPAAIPSREQMREFYEQMRQRKGRRAEGATFDSSLSPSRREGGYVSSEPSSGDARTAEELAAADKAAIARIRERAPDSITSTFERLISRAEERTGKALPTAREALEKLRRKVRGGK